MNADFEEELHEKRIDDVFAQGEVLIPAAVTEIMGWEPGTELMAVSYTHLDVYKRQQYMFILP